MAKCKHVEMKMTVEEALGCASDISDLQDEMSTWRESLEEKFSGTDKYSQVSEAADALEQADMESKCDALVDALNNLEGSPFVAGCPEHVVGTPCARCKWNGVAKKPHGRKRNITRGPTTTTTTSDHYINGVFHKDRTETRTCYGQVDSMWYGVTESINGVDQNVSDETRASYQAMFEAEAAKATAYNLVLDTPVIPPRLKDEAEVLPLPDLEALTSRPCAWTEDQAYKGKSLSRASRLGNVTTALRAATSAVREALADHEADVAGAAKAAKDAGEPVPESADDDDTRIEAITEALDEIESALDELEGVEFPGMYG